MKVLKSKTIKTAIHIMICLCMILSTLSFNVFAEGEVTPLSSFAFTQDDDAKTVTLTKYIGTAPDVVVPGIYEIDGTTYDVIIDAATIFRNNAKVVSIKIGDGVKFKDNSTSHLFDKCAKLTTLDLTEMDTTGVTDMSYMFANSTLLTEIDVSNFDTSSVVTMAAMFGTTTNLSNLIGYEDWDTSSLENMRHMFNKVAGMERIDLSRWDLSKINLSRYCFQNCMAKEFLFPDSLALMSAGFFNHATGYEGESYTLPVGIKKIGYSHTFYDFGTADFEKFEVADGNTNYVAIDGVLYTADKTELIAMPRGKTFVDGTYEIEEGVTFLPELCFSRNMNLKKVILPDSYELRQYVPLNDPQYVIGEDMGNINDTSSLTLALNVYTDVTDYEVKDTNSRYESVDGILYSEDMTTLLAIPMRYDRVINIPEGVTTWENDAMWENTDEGVVGSLVRSSGVNIPESMINIDNEQIKMLNRLEGKNGTTYGLITGFANSGDSVVVQKTTYTFDFTISVHEDNPYYSTNANGQLIAFGAALSEKSFGYDGTAKTPAVTVGSAGTILTEGTDYTVEYIDNTNIGTAKAVVTGIGTYAGKSITKTFKIAVDAKIGDTLYTNIADALEAGSTAESATITLLQDVTFNEAYTIKGNITIEGEHAFIRDESYTGEIFNIEAGSKLFLKGGTFSEDVDEYCAPGYTAYNVNGEDGAPETYSAMKLMDTGDDEDIYKVIKLMNLEYEDVTPLGTEGEKLYNINLVTTEGDTINRLNSVDLTFEFDKENDVTYEIIPFSSEIEINPVENSTTRYEFHYNGKDGVTSDTANKITIGQVRFTGYGKFTFSVDESVDTNIANTTTYTNNIVENFIAVNGIDSDIIAGKKYLNIENTIEDVIKLPLRELEVNVVFPNNVKFNSDDYQKMTVKVTGGLVDQTFNLGNISKAETPGDYTDDIVFGAEKSDYTLTAGTTTISLEETSGTPKDVTVNAYTLNLKLPMNTNYTIEVTGDGYRTSRYNVVLSGNKILNFWNNVMDTERVIENGLDSSKVQHNFLAGDIVEDNEINIYDLSAVVSYFAKAITDPAEYEAYVKYDLNRDGIIDSKDVAYVLVSWGN